MINTFMGKYRFLSNFWISPVTFEGDLYPCSENAYQAAKTTNKDYRLKFMDEAFSPKEAKKTGKKLPIREDWEQVKFQVMEDIVRDKFTHPEVRQLLLDTGDEELIEGNSWNDVVWGVCKGIGENRLGKILMKVREELKQTKTVENDEIPFGKNEVEPKEEKTVGDPRPIQLMGDTIESCGGVLPENYNKLGVGEFITLAGPAMSGKTWLVGEPPSEQTDPNYELVQNFQKQMRDLIEQEDRFHKEYDEMAVALEEATAIIKALREERQNLRQELLKYKPVEKTFANPQSRIK